MTTTTFERLNSSPMIPKFIKEKLKKKIEMNYWSSLCGISKRRKSFIKNLKTYRIHKLTTKLHDMEERMEELEEKMKKFDEIFQKEKSEKE